MWPGRERRRLGYTSTEMMLAMLGCPGHDHDLKSAYTTPHIKMINEAGESVEPTYELKPSVLKKRSKGERVREERRVRPTEHPETLFRQVPIQKASKEELLSYIAKSNGYGAEIEKDGVKYVQVGGR